MSEVVKLEPLVLQGLVREDRRVDGALWGASQTPDGAHRFALWRLWDEGKLPLVIVGLNPSTADAVRNDPTIVRCMGFARKFGRGGLIMLNLFSFRATKPRNLYKAWHASQEVRGDPTNSAIMDFYAAKVKEVVCAWGNLAYGFQRQAARVHSARMARYAKLLHLGAVTSAGWPRHPLYQRRTARLAPWRFPR